MFKTILIKLFLFTIIVPFAQASTQAPAPMQQKRSCYQMDPVACDTFYRTNDERRRYGLPQFEFLPRCFDMAQDQSRDMAVRGYFSHERPTRYGRKGERFDERAARFGLSYGVGENIAMTETAASAVSMWMHSPGHRRNILNPKFRYLAVGYQNGYFTQVFAQ